MSRQIWELAVCFVACACVNAEMLEYNYQGWRTGVVAESVTGTPFGLQGGMTQQDLKQLGARAAKGETYWFDLSLPPNPDRRFHSYRVLAAPSTGLCIVLARTPEIATDRYGEQLQAVFHTIQESLTTRYGVSPTVFDEISADSALNDPRDWMKALLEEERILSAFWVTFSSSLAMTTIELRAFATGTERGIVGLTYTFPNATKCRKEVDAEEAKRH